MSKNSESGQVGLTGVARLIKMELETAQIAHGAAFISVQTIATAIDAVPALVERVARQMGEVDLATAPTIRKEHDPDFPLVMRGKKEAEGHWPGIRLVSESERLARVAKAARRAKASGYVMHALTSAGLGGLSVTVDVESGAIVVTIADGVNQALAALQTISTDEGTV